MATSHPNIARCRARFGAGGCHLRRGVGWYVLRMTWSPERMRFVARLVAAGATVVAVAAGCGARTVDDAQAATTIAAEITAQQPSIGTVHVQCPSDVRAAPGATFRCTYTSSRGQSGTVDVTMTDDAGTLSIRYSTPPVAPPGTAGGNAFAESPGTAPDDTAVPDANLGDEPSSPPANDGAGVGGQSDGGGFSGDGGGGGGGAPSGGTPSGGGNGGASNGGDQAPTGHLGPG
jgi:Domain of unknown function (DUF4333)